MSIEQTKQLQKIYAKADPVVQELMIVMYGDTLTQKIDIKDCVKTFEDALALCPLETDNAIDFLKYNGADTAMLAAQAYLKLSIIAEALNEGWTPDWDNSSEIKYYPYFKMSGSGLSCYDFGSLVHGFGCRLSPLL